MLMCEELTRASVTTLDFVADENGVGFIAKLSQSLHELLADHADATYTLYALNDTSTYITLFNFLTPCIEVVERKIGDVVVGIDRGNDLWVIGHFNS